MQSAFRNPKLAIADSRSPTSVPWFFSAPFTDHQSLITDNGVNAQRAFIVKQRERIGAFTLLELLVVIAIIAILMVLVAPAFTNLKGGNDITAAAYTISGALEQARNYAMANNTYVYLGFYEEDATAST